MYLSHFLAYYLDYLTADDTCGCQWCCFLNPCCSIDSIYPVSNCYLWCKWTILVFSLFYSSNFVWIRDWKWDERVLVKVVLFLFFQNLEGSSWKPYIMFGADWDPDKCLHSHSGADCFLLQRGSQKVSRTSIGIVCVAWLTVAVCVFIALPSHSWLWLISCFK